jgi:hypothetical protein
MLEYMSIIVGNIHLGELNRAMASHNLNATSSRSHAMLSIQIEQDLQGNDDPTQQMTRQGKLVFVDLAGKYSHLCESIVKTSTMIHENSILQNRYVCYTTVVLYLGSEKVKDSLSTGKQLIETNNINKSLLALGNNENT